MIPHAEQLIQGAVSGAMLVLNFHCIGRPKRAFARGEAEVRVDVAQFAEILDVVEGREDVRITFDDGNASDVDVALPELLDRNLQAEFFVCAGRLGMRDFLSAEEVRELRRAGMAVGSHGMEHVPWRRLDGAGIDREIIASKHLLEEVLQEPVVAAACPFGAYDRRTLRALRGAGFGRVYTSDPGWASSDGWLIGRRTVRRSDSPESVARLLSEGFDGASLARRAKHLLKRWR